MHSERHARVAARQVGVAGGGAGVAHCIVSLRRVGTRLGMGETMLGAGSSGESGRALGRG